MKKVLTVGVFDLLHIGHIELFRKAKACGDYLIVAVQKSDSVLKYKPQSSLVYSTEERSYMVKSICYVNDVVEYEGVDSIVEEVDFDVFVKGPDQSHDGFQKAVEYCKVNGKEVVELPRTDGISSSELKQLIASMQK
ncbi:MAG: adenylyltransferase/cytidyltransferase family protein [Muribaculaceae bacterium]|nr:adenylyltransferase/cytidyltransferase family protein [Muribaculaceae bacterium]